MANDVETLAPDAVPNYEVRAVTAPAKKSRPARKPKTKAVVADAVNAEPVAVANRSTVKWATFGVGFTLVLSSLLNGYANAQHAPLAWAGWLMGLSVPVLVLVLAKVAGEKHRDGNKTIAYLSGGSGAALLFLSVYHCANSIAMLTGSGLFLAVPLAVAIDAGLVSMELALITEPRE